MVIEYALDPESPMESVALTVKADVPVTVGLPEMVPPVKVSPAGRVPVVTV